MIGCGAVTERKSAPAYRQVAGSALVAVSSRSPDRAADYAARNDIAHVFEDPAELIRSDVVDAVYIATPPSSHLDLALLAAVAGKPCSVEKPLAPLYPDARRLVDAFAAARQPLFVAYYRRALPRFEFVRSILNEGRIGEPRHIDWSLARTPTANDVAGRVSWRAQEPDAPGGYFDDLACHGLDLFDHLLGPIGRATGIATNQQGLYAVPDAVTGSWLHDSGVTGTGFWNFAAGVALDRVTIHGSRGRVSFAIFDEAPVVVTHPSGEEAVEIANPDPIQGPYVESVIAQLTGGTPCPSTGDSALRTARVCAELLGQSLT